MHRSVLVVGMLLIVFGLGVFIWKTQGLDMPIAPNGVAMPDAASKRTSPPTDAIHTRLSDPSAKAVTI